MKNFRGAISSKLSQTGTSIFTVMSAMAKEYDAINLSQGFPDFPVSEKLIGLVNDYMKKGYNQYAPMQGVPELRKQIAAKVHTAYEADYDPDTEINITAGATQAIYTAISSFVKDGDEVIIFEPAYDSYAPSVILNGGIVKHATLNYPDYHIDWQEVRKLITANTRMIIINSPHNPTGSVLKPADMKQLVKLTGGSDIIIVSDEVYEHLIYDGIRHESIALYPELASRSFVIGSFGKTFHATGWKLGFVLAPQNLMAEFRKAHQFIVFTCNSAIQYALAEYLSDSENYIHLSAFYQEKRDLFLELLKSSRFKPIPSYGTYFQLLDYSGISDEPETEFSVRLLKEYGIASIPVSAFYHKNVNNKVLRFCFAKKQETLETAAEKLCRI